MPPSFKDLESYWKSIANELHLQQLDSPITTISNYGNNIFSTICHLIETKFDVQFLRLYIVKMFCNAIMGKWKDSMVCLKKYLTKDAVQNQPTLRDGDHIL